MTTNKLEQVKLPAPGIDTANHASVRIRGYTEAQALAIYQQGKAAALAQQAHGGREVGNG